MKKLLTIGLLLIAAFSFGAPKSSSTFNISVLKEYSTQATKVGVTYTPFTAGNFGVGAFAGTDSSGFLPKNAGNFYRLSTGPALSYTFLKTKFGSAAGVVGYTGQFSNTAWVHPKWSFGLGFGF